MIVEVWRETLAVIQRRWREMLPVAIVIGFTTTAVGLAVRQASLTAVSNTSDPLVAMTQAMQASTTGLGVNWIVSMVLSAVIINMAAAGRSGGDGSAGAAFMATLRRFGALVWLSILTGIAIIVGLVLLILPGIWVAVGTFPAVPMLFVEGRTGTESFVESLRLSTRRWWAVLGVIATLAAVVLGVQLPGSVLSGTPATVYDLVTATVLAMLQPVLALSTLDALRRSPVAPAA